MKKFFPFLFFFHLVLAASAQTVQTDGTVPVDAANPFNTSALLELRSNNKGFLVPRMTAENRTGIQNPAQGLLVYQTDDNGADKRGFYVYNGTAWEAIKTNTPGVDGLDNHKIIKWLNGTFVNSAISEENGAVNITGSQTLISNAAVPQSTSAAAILEINSNDKGVLLPRLTRNERLEILNLGPNANGLLVYQTDNVDSEKAGFYVYDGGAWKAVTPEMPNLNGGMTANVVPLWNGNQLVDSKISQLPPSANNGIMISSSSAISDETVTPTAPSSSAVLSLNSTNKGLLVPRMTASQRTTGIASPAQGLLVYQTDAVAGTTTVPAQPEGFYVRQSSGWRPLSMSNVNLNTNVLPKWNSATGEWTNTALTEDDNGGGRRLNFTVPVNFTLFNGSNANYTKRLEMAMPNNEAFNMRLFSDGVPTPPTHTVWHDNILTVRSRFQGTTSVAVGLGSFGEFRGYTWNVPLAVASITSTENEATSMVYIPRLSIAGQSPGPHDVSQMLIERADRREWRLGEAPNESFMNSPLRYYRISTVIGSSLNPNRYRAGIRMSGYHLAFFTGAARASAGANGGNNNVDINVDSELHLASLAFEGERVKFRTRRSPGAANDIISESTDLQNNGLVNPNGSQDLASFVPIVPSNSAGYQQLMINPTSGEVVRRAVGVSPGSTNEARSIGVAPSNMDFQNVAVDGESRIRNLIITNTGNTTVTITSLSSTSPLFSSTNQTSVVFGALSGPPPFTILAGQSRAVPIHFRPAAIDSIYSVPITVNSNAGTLSFTVSGIGVLPSRTITVTPVDFPDAIIGTPGTRNVTITNNGNSTMVVTGFSSSSSNFSSLPFSGSNTQLAPASAVFSAPLSDLLRIPAGESRSVPIRFRPNAGGQHTADITVNANHTAGTNTFTAKGTGIVAGSSARMAPDSLERELVKIKAEQVALRNELNELKALVRQMAQNQGKGGDLIKAAYLEQNSPNPFNTETRIRYFVPSCATKAEIQISSLAGILLHTLEAPEKGTNAEVTLHAKMLQSGTYIYTLVVDGVQTDSKKMVIQ